MNSLIRLSVVWCFISFGCLYGQQRVMQDTVQDTVIHSRNLNKSIQSLEWTPDGKKLIVSFRESPLLEIYRVTRDELALDKTVRMGHKVTHVIRSAPEINLLAVGLANGEVHFLDAQTWQAADDIHTLSAYEIFALNWIGSSNSLLGYAKSAEVPTAGIDTHFPHKTVLDYIDRTSGSSKTYTLDHHVIALQVAPSGQYVALVKDLENKKQGLWDMEPDFAYGDYAVEIYSLSAEGKEPVKTGTFRCDVRVQMIEWTSDSKLLGALLDNGTFCFLNTEAHQVAKRQADALAHCTGEMSSSYDGKSFFVPTNRNTVIIIDAEQEDTNPRELFRLRRSYSAESIKRSPDGAFVALACGDDAQDLYDRTIMVRSMPQ